MTTAVQQEPVTKTSFDSAYEALQEVFPGHPLWPALRVEYIQGRRFEEISGRVWGPTDERRNRVRSIKNNAEIFWNAFNRYMHLSYKSYVSWVNELTARFFNFIVHSSKDDKELVTKMDRIRNALVRDFRYFGFHDQADQLDKSTISARGNPDGVVHNALESFFSTRDTVTGKPVKDGFPLSKRLCDAYRPLVLKCLCDLIKDQELFKWLEETRAGERIPSKFRLFWRNDENTKDWDLMIEENLTGVEAGEEGGQTLGNKWLASQYGLALMGGIAQLILGTGKHDTDTNFICMVFFYQNYDGWFERTLHEMVKKDVVQPGATVHVEVIKSHPRHYFNLGRFKHTQRVSTFMLPVMHRVNYMLQHLWVDSGILAKNVLDVLDERRVGSGSAGMGGPTLAEKLKKKHTKNLPKVQLSYAEEIETYQTQLEGRIQQFAGGKHV